MADELGMSRSTTHRYASTLVALSLLEQTGSRKYRVGSRAADVGMSAIKSLGLGDEARALLEELRRETSYAAVISVLDETEIIFVERARRFKPAERSVWMNLRIGMRLPAHHTAAGKVLLAHLPEQELAQVIESLMFRESTQRTVKSEPELVAALHETREHGFAISEEEWASDVVEIAVPVRNDKDKVGAALAVVALSSTASVAQLVSGIRPLAESTAGELASHLVDRSKF